MSDFKVSSKATARASSGGIGFCGLLTIVFIVLKLMGIITWPWIWVLAPLWISIAIGILITVLVFGVFIGFIAWLNK